MVEVREIVAIGIGLSLAAGAAAQVTVLDESGIAYDQLQDAIQAFSTTRSFEFEIDATQGPDPFHQNYAFVQGWFDVNTTGPRPVARFECNEYLGHRIAGLTPYRRIVADGFGFFVYEPKSNQYTAAQYSGGADLFKLISKAAKTGPSSLVATLLSQTFGGPTPHFKASAWLKNAKGIPSGGNGSTIVLQSGDAYSGQKSISFDTGFPIISRIIYFEAPPGGAGTRSVVNWEMKIKAMNGNAPMPGGNFTFSPPQGSQRIQSTG